MAKLRADISDVPVIPDTRRAPLPSTYGLPELIAGVGEGAKSLYKEAGKEALIGEEVEELQDIPGFEGFDPEGQLTPEAYGVDVPELTDFSKIKAARQQGLISATQAQLQVRRAIKAQAVDFPGLEEEFTRQAQKYFGKFGEGDLLLKSTPSENLQQKLHERIVLSPLGQALITDVNDPKQIGQVKNLMAKREINKFEKEQMELDLATGRVDVFEYGSAYIADQVDPFIDSFMDKRSKQVAAGEKLTDTVSVINELRSAKTLLTQGLSRGLNRIPGASSADKKGQFDQIDTAFERIVTQIKEGSFQKALEERNATFVAYARERGTKLFPELVSLREALGETLSSEVVKNWDRYARATEAQKQGWLNQYPEYLRGNYRNLLQNPHLMQGDVVKSINQGTPTTLDALPKHIIDSTAITMATGGNPALEEDTELAKNSLGYVLKTMATPAQGKEGLATLEEIANDPKASYRIKRDNKHKAAFVKTLSNWTQDVTNKINSIYVSELIGKTGSIKFDTGSKLFTWERAKFTPDQISKLSAKERIALTASGTPLELVNQLNVVNKIMKTWDGDLKNFSYDDWLGRTTDGLINSFDEALFEREAIKEEEEHALTDEQKRLREAQAKQEKELERIRSKKEEK